MTRAKRKRFETMKIDGEKVYAMRRAAGFRTQSSLADAAGLSQVTISKIESAHYHLDHYLRTIKAIARALGCDPEEILLRHEEKPKHTEHPKAKDGGITATVPRYATDEELVKVANAFRGSGVPVYFE